MNKIITLGGILQDIFIEYTLPPTFSFWDQGDTHKGIFLPQGHKITIDSLSYFGGGGALNSAISFARLGLQPTIIGKLGDDTAGQFIQNILKQENNIENAIIISNEYNTGISLIFPAPGGERTVLVYRGASNMLQLDEIPFLQFDASYLYCTSLSEQSAHLLPPLCTQLNKQNIRIAINPGSSQLQHNSNLVIEALPSLYSLQVNLFEATLLFECITQKSTSKDCFNTQDSCLNWLRSFFRCIQNYGIPISVVTCGAQGVYVAHNNTIYFHPSICTHPVSTLGAGDAFGSTFIACLIQGFEIQDALRAGIINSNAVLQQYGANTGLLSLAPLQQQLQQLNPTLLQQFSL